LALAPGCVGIVDQRVIMTPSEEKQRRKLTPSMLTTPWKIAMEEMEDVDSGNDSKNTSILFLRGEENKRNKSSFKFKS
jgi:hypothetical protein